MRDVVLYFITACTSLQWVAFAAAAGPRSLPAWGLAAVAMFLPVSVCTVALAARFPDQGGMYIWSKRAFGPFAAFLTGWTYWTSNLPYFAGMLYFAAGSALWMRGPALSAAAPPAWFIAFALGGLALATVLNFRGLEVSKWLNNAAALARCLTLIILLVLAGVVFLRRGSATALSMQSMRPAWRLDELLFWSTIAFAMTGPESASFMGGEIRDARRTVPRALLIAAPVIAAIYVLGTVAVLVAIPARETSAMYGVVQAVQRCSESFAGNALTVAVAALIVLTCLGSAGAWLGSVARIPFVAGLDHFLPRSFGRLHPRYGSPTTALIVQAVVAALFVIMGQAGTTVKDAYDVLINLMVIGLMLPYLFLFGATIRLAGAPRIGVGASFPGGRWVVLVAAAIGLATTIGAIGLALIPAPDAPNRLLAATKIAGVTVLMLGVGALFYAAGTRRATRLQPSQAEVMQAARPRPP